MNCINIKTKEFQELLEATKLPSLLLEMRIAKWQEQNGLDNFPKVEDIIQSNEVNFQKNQTISNEGKIVSEKTIRDLSSKIADRIGIPYKIESSRTKEYKGKIENGVAYINLAYATLDTPIHEILGHPIIRVIKNGTELTDFKYNIKELNDLKAPGKFQVETFSNETLGDIDFFETKEEAENYVKSLKLSQPKTQLYQNLLKELETGKGKEVLDRIKRDYNLKNKPEIIELESITGIGFDFEVNGKSFGTKGEAVKEQEKATTYYSLEEQQEEAIVELLGLMTAEKLDKVKDGKLISLLKRLLKEMKQFVRSLLNQKEVEIDKLPDNMTLGDLSDLLAYSNSKLILPGYEVEYTTPDNEKFKTYQEASNHVGELAKNVKDVDLDNFTPVNKWRVTGISWGYDSDGSLEQNGYINEEFNTKEEAEEYYNRMNNTKYVGELTINEANSLPQSFIEKNKEYEQSKEIIEEWKKVNNIQYNPEEIYSRGQEFSSVVGAYSEFDVNLMMQNLLSHIEDNEKAGGKFAISAYTKPIDKQIGHLEGGGGKIKFKLYPQSNDILWAANTDVYSGSVWDASEKVNKDKKSELLGVSYTKYPSLQNVNAVQPNLADIVDELNHHHNELGIVLTGNNFRLEYDQDIPYQTKKIIDSINSILDQKYGKLIKPKVTKTNIWNVFRVDEYKETFNTEKEAEEFIKKQNVPYLHSINKEVTGIQPTQTKETLKENIDSIKIKIATYETALDFYNKAKREYNDSLITYETKLEKYEDNQKGIIDKYYGNYTDLNGKLDKKVKVFTINVGNTTNEIGMWQNEKDYDTVKDYIVKEEENQHGVKFWVLSNEFKKEALKPIEKPQKPEDFNLKKPLPENYNIKEKEYTSQALINTKVATLKEVAKKQPRSLIRSEVKPINRFDTKSYEQFDELEDLPFQKVPSVEKNRFTDFVGDTSKPFFPENTVNQPQVNNRFETNKELLFGKKSIENSFYAKEVLQNIINTNLPLTENALNLLTKASNVLHRTNARVKVISQERFDKMTKDSVGEGIAVMAYMSELNVIYLTEYTLQTFNSSVIIEAFIHEVAHDLSIKALVNPITHEEKQFNELISKAFEQYKYLGENKNSKSYGFTNKKEFVAELYSNRSFRDEIVELDRGFWRKFKDAIRRLFGLTKSLENDELINSILLLKSVDKFIEGSESQFDNLTRNNYDDAFNNILFKKVEQPKEIELDTLDKQLNYTIEKALDKIDAIIRRTKKSKTSKNKQDNEAFIKSFTDLFKEIETLENTNKWQAINAYVTSFSKTVFSLNQTLKTKLYDKDSETFTKDITSQEMLDLSYRYDEYLAAYDLLEDIKKLLQTSETDEFITKESQAEINTIKDILADLSKDHNSLTGTILNIKKAYAVKMISESDLNTETVTRWRDKLFKEHADLKITGETREAYFGRMIEGKYKDEYNKALVANARKIVNDPSFDIDAITRSSIDILNTNSPLLNMMSNVIGKMRDTIISTARTKNFEIDKVYKKYSAEKGQNKQSQMYKNLVELSKSDDRYYLHGEYSTAYLDSFNSLQPVFKERKELVTLKLSEGLTQTQIKKLPEYKSLNKKIATWFKQNTIKVDKTTLPHPKYKNKELTGIEKETLDYFISETEKNDDIYNGTASLITLIPGAKFYKLPSVTKSDLERTLEGDIKGQFVDKWKDLNEVRVDDVSYGEAINSKNEELRTVRVHYRGKLESKNQSLDLFTVYRKEAFNAINYNEKKDNEYKLKLFVDIASSKEYKKRSDRTGKWAQNVFATKQPGVTFPGEFSEELKRIKGLLESTAYDVLSYNGQKVLGTNIEANKLSSLINGTAASIAMTMNLGSGVVNVMNGVTQMFIESVGGRQFSKSDLLKAEANYSKNLMNILADLNEPVKKSFHNQMLEMFDIFGGFDVSTQEFLRNSYAKKLISKQQMNMLNEMGEHMMNSVLTEVILRGLKVMNEQRQYIDKNGNVVEESKAASLFDMLFLNKDGVLEMDKKVVYTLKNLDSKYHENGKYHINYVIKKKAHDIFGVYDPLMKAEIAKNWWGKTVLMFKNFFLSGLKYRYQGISKSLKKKEDLTDEDIVFNNAEQEFTEGTYTTFIRFIRNVVFPALKGLQLAHMSDGYNKLTDYEKANLKKTTLEVGLTMVILPMLGYLLASLGGDDDDKPYFALYVFRRLESELSQYRNPIELNRMIQNPVAANRFLQNSLNALGEIITPLNFNPGNNEYFFDYLSEDSKGNNKVIKSIKKITPFYAQFQKPYREMHNLINK